MSPDAAQAPRRQLTLLQSLPLRLRMAAFRAMEALADKRNGPSRRVQHATPSEAPRAPPSLWVFVSTIGELNAVDPLLQRILVELGHPPLTLLSDRDVYADAYRARYPQARLIVLQGTSAEALTLALTTPPLMCVVAEIPALLHDAPCRLSFALLHAARQAGAPVVLVNGWGYGYVAPSRMDMMELRLFGSDYVRCFDLMLVQTDAFAAELIARGSPPERVRAVGNIKFDAMDTKTWSAAQARSPRLLQALLDAGRPTIVAGCVTDADEQQRVLDAFTSLCVKHPRCLLVIAPRHPENREMMSRLRELLHERGLTTVMRSERADCALSGSTAVLVLDTMGELRDFYAAAAVAHVGVDHNVLEPLAFGKPVTVSPGWNRSYPSFPVYALLIGRGGLLEATDAAQLAGHWARCLAVEPAHGVGLDASRTVLQQARGATERHLHALAPWLERIRQRPPIDQLAAVPAAARKASSSA